MNKKTILIFSTYPMLPCFHGGQRRLSALCDAYSNAGYDPVVVAHYNGTAYKARRKHNHILIPASKNTQQKITKSPLTEDIILGYDLYDDVGLRGRILSLIRKYRPTFITIEQSYPYLGIKKIIEEYGLGHIPLINSTHNVEHQMKEEIYKSFPEELNKEEALKLLEQIKSNEQNLATEAAITLVVSETDLITHKKLGAKKAVVIKNGINEYNPRVKQEHWIRHFKQKNITKPLLFTGSAHAPNLTGFINTIGYGVGFIPAQSKIIIVGDIGRAIYDRIETMNSTTASTFWNRAEVIGRVNDSDLAAIISLSHAILLPILSGGGSNLKTAEAILSRKHVVATDYAMRGYEEFLDFPNIHVVKDLSEYRSKIASVLELDPPLLSKEQTLQTRSVLWKNRVEPLQELLRGGMDV